MILLNPQNDNYLIEVAELHRKYIPTGFISRLGVKFLKCFYKSLADYDDGLLAVFIDPESHKLAGFISGVVSVERFKKEFLKRCRLPLAYSLFLALPRLRMVIESYRYSSGNEGLIKSELVSIVVDEDYRGKGISRDLYNSLIEFFKRKGIKKFKILVGANLIGAQRFYEKMGAKIVGIQEVHRGVKSFVYVHEIDPT